MIRLPINKLSAAAPMTSDEKRIAENSMKFYSYLVCISGLATYPPNTRMFKQNNLNLREIQRCTGITDKTVKLYMWYLEENNLVRFIGDSRAEINQKDKEQRTKHIFVNEIDYESHKDYVAALKKEAEQVWRRRNKFEKNGVYHIPKPPIYTPIPEITLEKLNQVFNIDENCFKIYIACCRYRDLCAQENRNYKVLTFNMLRDILGLKSSSITNSAIRKSLVLLKGIGLIDFEEGVLRNQKGAKISSFKLSEVYYYVSYSIDKLKWETDDEDTPEIIELLKTYDESYYQ